MPRSGRTPRPGPAAAPGGSGTELAAAAGAQTGRTGQRPAGQGAAAHAAARDAEHPAARSREHPAAVRGAAQQQRPGGPYGQPNPYAVAAGLPGYAPARNLKATWAMILALVSVPVDRRPGAQPGLWPPWASCSASPGKTMADQTRVGKSQALTGIILGTVMIILSIWLDIAVLKNMSSNTYGTDRAPTGPFPRSAAGRAGRADQPSCRRASPGRTPPSVGSCPLAPRPPPSRAARRHLAGRLPRAVPDRRGLVAGACPTTGRRTNSSTSCAPTGRSTGSSSATTANSTRRPA